MLTTKFEETLFVRAIKSAIKVPDNSHYQCFWDHISIIALLKINMLLKGLRLDTFTLFSTCSLTVSQKRSKNVDVRSLAKN